MMFVPLLTLLVFIKKAVANSDQCLYSQPHIAFGDRFSDPKSDRIFTIGLVSNGPCLDDPLSSPLVSIRGNGDKVVNVTAGVIEPHYTNTLYEDVEVVYNRTSYFFFLTEKDLEGAKTWEIHTRKTLDIDLFGPYKLPTRPFDNSKSTKGVVVADLDAGQAGQETLARFKKMKQDDFDFIMHVGDFAYDIWTDNGTRGDRFFDEMASTLSTRVPYVIAGGNHEQISNGTMLQYRFQMPGCNERKNRRNYYYSFDLKNVHFISIDMDFLFNYQDFKYQLNVYKWLVEDLKKTEKTKPRWIVYFNHRPLHCPDPLYCGTNFWYFRKFEVLLNKYNSRLFIFAHIHQYLKTYPFRDFKIQKDGLTAPVQIINGHAGTNHKFSEK